MLTSLASLYFSKGMFGPRTQAVYEKARMASPTDQRFAQALSISSFLRHLRRFTVEAADPEQLDQEGVRGTSALIKEYLKELPNSPDLFCALADLYLIRGKILLAIGAYENAIKVGYSDLRAILRAYEFAIRMHTFQPSERSYFAGLYRQIGMKQEALDLFRQVTSEGFHDPTVVSTLIEMLQEEADGQENVNQLNGLLMEITALYLDADRVAEALQTFRRVRFPVHQSFSLVKRVASLLIQRQDYRLAFEYLSRIPVDDENKALINRIAMELERIGEDDTAGELLKFINDNDALFKEAQEQRDKEIEIHAELAVAELNFNNGRYDMALSNYTRVLADGYKDDGFVLAKIVELLPLIRRDHLDDLHAIGSYYLQRQDFYRASQFYDLVLERKPDDPLAQKRMREIYTAILQRNPNLPELRLRSGDLYMAVGQLDMAVGEFKHAAQFPETNIEAVRRQAIAQMKLENYSAALEAFQQMPVNEMDLENLYQLHLVMQGKGRVADALGLLRLIAGVDDTYRDVTDRIELLHGQFAEESQKLFVDPKMRDLIGDIAVGRYRYIEKIGTGGMGVVHKVYDLKLNKAVAMKILREGLANSSKAIDRFFREARIAATLNHPNIVNIFDYNINNQTQQSFISMEYVDGLSVRDMFEEYFIQTTDGVPEERVVESLYYMSQICDALQVTHSKGIIHRDIKPDNLLVSRQHVAKITDFGIVHIEEATFTPTGALIGTPRYMAPEQVQGVKIDGRADLYSAGIILYEWLIGTPPFVSGDVAYQQVNVNPTPPIDLKKNVPPELNDLILKCLEKNPADRYQNANDLKAAIDQIMKKIAPGGPSFVQRPQGETDMDDMD